MTIEKRRRYCEGITSEEYIRTGAPRNASAAKKEDDAILEKVMERNRQNTAKVAKDNKPKKSKRKGPEYKIAFE